jgi:hypothetical protein
VLIKRLERWDEAFITTHFHELLDHPNLKEMVTLKIQHMSMRTDSVHGLIYERKLCGHAKRTTDLWLLV